MYLITLETSYFADYLLHILKLIYFIGNQLMEKKNKKTLVPVIFKKCSAVIL